MGAGFAIDPNRWWVIQYASHQGKEIHHPGLSVSAQSNAGCARFVNERYASIGLLDHHPRRDLLAAHHLRGTNRHRLDLVRLTLGGVVSSVDAAYECGPHSNVGAHRLTGGNPGVNDAALIAYASTGSPILIAYFCQLALQTYALVKPGVRWVIRIASRFQLLRSDRHLYAIGARIAGDDPCDAGQSRSDLVASIALASVDQVVRQVVWTPNPFRLLPSPSRLASSGPTESTSRN